MTTPRPAFEALTPAARRLTQALGQAVASRLLDDISKALPADRGPMAATKDARRAFRAAMCAQRS